MKVVIDDKIPYIAGVLEPYAEVVYLPGDEITAEVVKDADALITRTRTTCNRQTLQGSKVKFIATATIGFDHIDTDYCKRAGIEWANAPGCNAESVNQYILSALFSYAKRKGLALQGTTIGIVGVGQVGSRVAASCETLGMQVLLNDPPRQRAEGSASFVSLQSIREQADFITFHVPLNRQGADRTFHLVNQGFLQKPDKKPLIINTCRGEVFDTVAVCDAITGRDIAGAIVDCWENEPTPDASLLNLADYATAHIAGYSRDGKANGTSMSVRAISRFFELGIDHWQPTNIESPRQSVIELDGSRKAEHEILSEAIIATYDIESDDRALRENPHLFEQLRGDYPVRREFDFYAIRALNIGTETLGKLQKLGFKRLN